MKNLFSMFVFCVALAVCSATSVAGPYTIIDIGPMTTPLVISNKSVVVGYKTTPDGHRSAFYYSRNYLKDLGTFNGTDSEALDVNSSGQIVGTFRQNGATRGFKLTGSGFADLFATAGLVEAVGINDSGVILGSIAPGPEARYPDAYYPVLLQNGVVKNIGLGVGEPGDAPYVPLAVNSSGQAIFTQTMCGSWDCEYGYFYNNGAAAEIPLTPTDLNNRGEIIGWDGIWSHGVIYKNGSLTTIDGTGWDFVYPTAINDIGQAVGSGYPMDGEYNVPFLYQNNVMVDLNTQLPLDSGWKLQGSIDTVYDINNYGQIVGVGILNGERHGFLMSPTYKVSGAVRDGSTGQGLSGATVSIAGSTATTDSGGYFALNGILPGVYTATITRSGYATKTVQLTVDRDLTGQIFYLGAQVYYSISGTVRAGTSTGPGLPGATVSVAGKVVVTSSTGAFSITGIPAGTYTLTIFKTGYKSATYWGYVINSNRSGLVFYLTPSPTYYISGTVRSGGSTGPVLPGAKVSIAGQSILTGSTGTFRISGILAGTYTLTISKFGYATRTVTGFVVNSNRTGLAYYLVPLPTYAISGTVRSGSTTGPVLPGATVSIAGKTATTSSTGTFSISGIPSGTHTLTISKFGYATRTVTGFVVNSNRAGLVFYLVPLPTYAISGTVRSGSTTGPVVPGATVSIAGKSATTSSTGTFSISGIPSGTYTLAISKSGFATRTVTGFVVTSNRTGLVFYLVPLPTYAVSGTVRTGSSTGPVLPGATVSIAGKSTTTTSTGTFSISGILAGTYTLTISKAGYATKTFTGYVISGNKTGLVFYLSPTSATSVTRPTHGDPIAAVPGRDLEAQRQGGAAYVT